VALAAGAVKTAVADQFPDISHNTEHLSFYCCFNIIIGCEVTKIKSQFVLI
jgi:hypothetical protein